MRKGILGIVMVLGMPAAAGAWGDCRSRVAVDAGPITLSKNQVTCFDTADATSATTGMVFSPGCMLDIQFDPDATGSGTGAVAQLYRCSTPTTTSCEKMLVAVDGDGIPDDVTLDGTTIGREGQQYQTAIWWYATITAPGAGDYARLIVGCQ